MSMPVWRCTLVIALIAVSLAPVPPARAAPAAPGDLDLTFAGFGAGGKVIAGPGGAPGGLALQADGKIVVAGTTGSSVFVIRYLPNGARDLAFGNGGMATISSAAYGLRANAVATQSDGKVVIAGWINTSPTDFLLARLTPAGVLDTSFGIGGLVTTDFDFDGDVINAVLIQADGKIIAAGTAYVGGDPDFAVARYTASGALDNTFGGDGRVTIPFGGDDRGSAIARQDDGKLLLAGSSFGGILLDDDFALARLNTDGALDDEFDDDGKLTTDSGGDELAQVVLVQPNTKIVVIGDNHSEVYAGSATQVLAVRYQPNGYLDNSFDGDGKRTIGSLSGEIYAGALQPDGKILALGHHASPDGDNKLALYRLNPDGSMDTTLDGDGDAFIDLGGDDSGKALALQPDGRLLIYGRSGGSQALLRLWPDGTFDSGGWQALGFDDPGFAPGSDEIAYGLALQADGKMVLAGEVFNADGTESDAALARFWPDGRPDTSFGIQGRVLFGPGVYDSAQAVAIQPDGKIVVAGTSDPPGSLPPNFLVARFQADGTPDPTFYGFGLNVADFVGGGDYGQALALAPDGKLVVAGAAWNGTRYVFGVARFNGDGTPDTTFEGDGEALFQWVQSNWASAVVVQPDHKIVVGGTVAGDFALVRFDEDGALDATFGSLGTALTDMGGSDDLRALLLTPGGWFVAAGSRAIGSSSDFALAQYTPDGVLPPGPPVNPGQPWPKAFVDWGNSESVFALDMRGDGRLVAAGCSDGQFAWAQFRLMSVPAPLKATAGVAGSNACAQGVRFAGSDRLLAAGMEEFNGDANMALARFETTLDTGLPPPTYRLFLPLVQQN
jgi:uncharacterized delta-60 repeat protein